MIEIFGNFREELPKNEQFLVISFSPGSIPLQQRWRNNGLSADFVADYLVTFFPASEDDPKTLTRQIELKGAVSYVANELLENALKYHDDISKNPIQFGIYLLQDTVILFSTNYVSEFQLKHLYEAIEMLTTQDPEDLYIQQIEKLAEEGSDSDSGMGLITIIHDYHAKLGWKIEAVSEPVEKIEVTTMVQLSI